MYAFSSIVKKYRKQVHALAWRIVEDFHIAEEITQDTFLIAYKDLKKTEGSTESCGMVVCNYKTAMLCVVA